MRGIYDSARRIAVIVAGSVLVIAGIAMLVLPGPGVAAILAGLALLGTQFPWARRLLDWARAKARSAASRIRGRRSQSSAAAPPSSPLSPELKPRPH